MLAAYCDRRLATARSSRSRFFGRKIVTAAASRKLTIRQVLRSERRYCRAEVDRTSPATWRMLLVGGTDTLILTSRSGYASAAAKKRSQVPPKYSAAIQSTGATVLRAVKSLDVST